MLEPHPQEPHYYIFIGLDNSQNSLNIDCQFDLCTAGFTRRLGGVFLRDADRNVYIGHTGLIGGGVPGVGRNAFIAYARPNTVSIAWPDGLVTDGFAVSNIHSPTLASALRDFAELKRQFKASVTV